METRPSGVAGYQKVIRSIGGMIMTVTPTWVTGLRTLPRLLADDEPRIDEALCTAERSFANTMSYREPLPAGCLPGAVDLSPAAGNGRGPNSTDGATFTPHLVAVG